MYASLRSLVSCRPITTNISQRKKDIWEIEKFEKYNQKNVYVSITYNSIRVCMCVYVCVCVCVCWLFLRIIKRSGICNG